jgi:hypothetical protein
MKALDYDNYGKYTIYGYKNVALGNWKRTLLDHATEDTLDETVKKHNDFNTYGVDKLRWDSIVVVTETIEAEYEFKAAVREVKR